MTVRLGLLAASRIAKQAIVEPSEVVAGVRVVGVAARDPRRSKATAKDWAVEHSFGSYAEMIKSD